MVGLRSTPRSCSISLTVRMRASKSRAEGSTRWMRRSASLTTPKVLLNEATKWGGSLLMKPTVSVRRTFLRGASQTILVVESRVAKSLSLTST